MSSPDPATEARASSNDPAEPSGPYSKLYTGYVLGMVLTTMIFANIDRTILSILVRPVKEEFRLSDTQMGLLLGPAFALVYTLFSLPIGRYADAGGSRRTIVAASLFLWSCFTTGTAFVTSYWQLFVMRMGVG
ncbi:MAG: MFS transporter, partial [Deltaproteobacteria bacterium]|nr:MFS transporter [Deltaproteobacteria bacterium]